jgi:ketosteroid isomerase-like protein
MPKMETPGQPITTSVLDRLVSAQNQHDLEAFLACFDPNYQSEQPAHPTFAFTGREQVRKNWSMMFSSFPDFRSELLRAARVGDTVWAEWRWTGTGADGTRLHMRGVSIFGVREDRITWGRLYMESVQETGLGIDELVKNMTKGTQQAR